VALSQKRTPNYALDNADIVREAMLRQALQKDQRRSLADGNCFTA
jgi:hypothetical protein